MPHEQPVRIAGLAVLVAVGLAGCDSAAGAPASPVAPAVPVVSEPPTPSPHESPPGVDRRPPGPFGTADGTLPGDVTVFDDRYPAITRLDPALLRALRSAAADAADDGHEIHVNSGWRSERYQERLFRQAVAEYGSTAKAARWVARPGTSVHEAGGAVDVGPDDAADWLAEHGAGYGLCRVYRNEPWHFELRPGAVRDGCPARYADPAHDPRMQP
jgi:D-alanyl-D-alanine carboxypeptidase